MGFYLPGIGEAIGGALRMKRQGELMEQSQKVLQDDTKPWSERVALVTAAHPELATNPQLQAMLEAGRQADQDKIARAKFDQEQAAAASAQRFQDLLGKTPVEQQRALIMNNPDMASRVVPEQLKTYQAEDAAIKEEDRWLRRNELTSAQKDRRAAVAAGAAANNKALDRYLAGQMDASGNLIPPEVQAANKREQELATADAKAEQVATRTNQTREAALDDLTVGLTEYRNILESEGRTGGFGADAAELEALRMSLGVKLAQADNPGRAPTDADVKVAMQRIPDTGFMTSPTSAIAQVDRLIKDAKGFKKTSDIPEPPPGFTVRK
jgi:hypothetical protein